ncbi:MAG TPA: hypothetical protein PLB24_07830 [Comamonas denitrificans]|nr:hypothetical protein [Comamonas denitrificans]
MSTFTHTPRPPCVCKGQYANQRRFGPPGEVSNEHPQPLTHGETTLGVYRDAKRQVAELEINVASIACIGIELTPTKLRELAARLLDAAHDIEANPAAMLMLAQAAEQEAA